MAVRHEKLGSACRRWRRTLRNVEPTVPYGRAGQLTRPRGFVAHYSDSATKLGTYIELEQPADLPSVALDDEDAILTTRDALLIEVRLRDLAINEITALMCALTDARARDLAGIAPSSVPSWLPMDR